MIQDFINNLELTYTTSFKAILNFTIDTKIKIQADNNKYQGKVTMNKFLLKYTYNNEGIIKNNRLYTIHSKDSLDFKLFSYKSEEYYTYENYKLKQIDYTLERAGIKKHHTFTEFPEKSSDFLTAVLNLMYSIHSKNKPTPINFVLQGKPTTVNLKKQNQHYTISSKNLSLKDPILKISDKGIIEALIAKKAFIAKDILIELQ